MKTLTLAVSLIALAVLASSAGPAPLTRPAGGANAGGGAADDPAPALVTAMYDVGDLLRAPPDQSLENVAAAPVTGNTWLWPRSSGGMFVGEDRNKPPVLEASDLVRLVETFVSGGSVNPRLEVIGQTLVVRHAPAAQKEVAALLAEFRRSRQSLRSVNIEAHWILLEPGRLPDILARRDGADEREVDLAAVGKLGPAAPRATGRLSCSGGQQAVMLAGRVRSLVTDFAPIMHSDGEMVPEVSRLLDGLVLQLAARIDGDAATVSLVSTASDLDPVRGALPQTRPASAPEPPRNPRLFGYPFFPQQMDRVDAAVHELRTTARLPLGKPTLVGGMSVAPGNAGGRSRELYLVVRVTSGR